MPVHPSVGDDFEHVDVPQEVEWEHDLTAKGDDMNDWWRYTAQQPQMELEGLTMDGQSSRDVITSLSEPWRASLRQGEINGGVLPNHVDSTQRSSSIEGRRKASCDSCRPNSTLNSSSTGQPVANAAGLDNWFDMTQDDLSEHDPLAHQDVVYDDGSNIAFQTKNDDLSDDADDLSEVRRDYDAKWMLNLSMHYRDKSKKEKFFITYAQTPTLWRRMTISIDYKNLFPDSLEAELNDLHYQRDKSFRIFRTLRESLYDIQYFDAVTNLKLETAENGKLHVHVREDGNESIDYPDLAVFDHITCPRYIEDQLVFDSHVSGFVYKVKVNGTIYIKKEIPGRDAVDEFIYEVNALDALQDSSDVMHLAGLITDKNREVIKGLLVEYAGRGALVDAIYDWEEDDLHWDLRMRWAQQMVRGLSAIHACGFVQGDFTLSNIVIDEDKNAHIIDINRRGCPIGWESPELTTLILQGQRVSMYIGVKTDIFQLGMVLWALAKLIDEPDRIEKPLPELDGSIPGWYRNMVSMCLHDKPKDRPTAERLLHLIEDQLRSDNAGGHLHRTESAVPSKYHPPRHADSGFVEGMELPTSSFPRGEDTSF